MRLAIGDRPAGATGSLWPASGVVLSVRSEPSVCRLARKKSKGKLSELFACSHNPLWPCYGSLLFRAPNPRPPDANKHVLSGQSQLDRSRQFINQRGRHYANKMSIGMAM